MKKLFNLISLILIASSCGSTKMGKDTAEAKSAKELVSQHLLAENDFTTLAARVQVAYLNPQKEQRVMLSMRFKKDEVIWAKASILGITIAKAMITPNAVTYYETIGKTYFEGDFSLISAWIGADLNFQQLQSLLLGQSIFPLKPGAYESALVQNHYQLTPKKQQSDFIHTLFLDPISYKISSATLKQPQFNRILTLRYGPYQKIGNQFFPGDISVVNTEDQEQTKIEVNYKKIDLNVDVSFPFEIPSGYERIEL